MNVIISYLDTMFAAYPASPRLVEARAELQAMMEDAYAAAKAAGLSENEAVGKVITEFGNLDELAPVLGITRELAPTTLAAPPAPQASSAALAPAAAPAVPASPAASTPVQAEASPQRASAYPSLDREEAQSYANLRADADRRLGLGVALLVVAAAPLVILATVAAEFWTGDVYKVALFAGIMVMVALIACGVLVLVGRSQRLAPFARIERGHFSPTPEATQFSVGLAAQEAPARTGKLQVAIGLWIFAFAPIFAVTLLPDGWSGAAVGCALVLVALGLLIFLPANWAASVAGQITQEGRFATDGSVSPDDDHSIVGVIASFYWPLVTLGYLAWSFIGDAWGSSWIVWPIAGVLFGALAAGFGSWESYRASKR